MNLGSLEPRDSDEQQTLPGRFSHSDLTEVSLTLLEGSMESLHGVLLSYVVTSVFDTSYM